MITLEAPHVGLNSIDTWSEVRMWRTPRRVEATKTCQQVLDVAISYAARASEGKIKNLVFSCHGLPGYLQIGTGIRQANVNEFRSLRGLVDKIWFHACLVAGRNASGQRVGNRFCSGIARAARCYVVASTELQVGTTGRILPYGKLDTFEGLVVSYGPEGDVTWRHRYPSTYQRVPGDRGTYVQNPD